MILMDVADFAIPAGHDAVFISGVKVRLGSEIYFCHFLT